MYEGPAHQKACKASWQDLEWFLRPLPNTYLDGAPYAEPCHTEGVWQDGWHQGQFMRQNILYHMRHADQLGYDFDHWSYYSTCATLNGNPSWWSTDWLHKQGEYPERLFYSTFWPDSLYSFSYSCIFTSGLSGYDHAACKTALQLQSLCYGPTSGTTYPTDLVNFPLFILSYLIVSDFELWWDSLWELTYLMPFTISQTHVCLMANLVLLNLTLSLTVHLCAMHGYAATHMCITHVLCFSSILPPPCGCIMLLISIMPALDSIGRSGTNMLLWSHSRDYSFNGLKQLFSFASYLFTSDFKPWGDSLWELTYLMPFTFSQTRVCLMANLMPSNLTLFLTVHFCAVHGYAATYMHITHVLYFSSILPPPCSCIMSLISCPR